MDLTAKKEAIRNLTFGNQIAEEERSELKEYFVKTQAWERIYQGEIDLIYGPKGSGKSALYVLIQDHQDELFDRNILLVAAENPQGSPAFRDLTSSPPTSEREFISIWKLYFLTLIARTLNDFGISNADQSSLASILSDNHLLPEKRTTLGSILASVRRYVSKYLNPSEVQGDLEVDSLTGTPKRFSGKIVFEEPNIAEQKQGFLSVDEMLKLASSALRYASFDVWITVDRLDVAFDESSELEKNALRALFKAYRDLRNHEEIKIKIFLRTDIWKRITQDGFREATHISRDIHLNWNKASLSNLIVRRLLNNPSVVRLYSVNPQLILTSTDAQSDFLARVLPEQVELGEKQSTTMDWLLKRTADGTNQAQPRDIILFLNSLGKEQNLRLERGDPVPPGEWLFERSAFKEALPALSEYRVTKVLFAEYPQLRSNIEAMREQKTEHNASSLSRIWGVTQDQAVAIARQLRDIGFFEERSPQVGATYWVPFVYRP